MSEMTIFIWNKEKVLWFLDFLHSIFTSVVGWSARYANAEVHNTLSDLETQINNTRKEIGDMDWDPNKEGLS